MKKSLFTFLLFSFCLLGINGQEVYSNQVIVKLKKEYSPIENAQKVLNIGKSFSALKTEKKVINLKENRFVYNIEFPEGTDFKKVVEEYEKTGEVEYAEPNYIIHAPQVQVDVIPNNLLFAPKTYSKQAATTPNDTYFFRQWALYNDGSFTFNLPPPKPSFSGAVAGADIDMERAWDIEKGNSSIIVAVIDTGIKMDHPELTGRMWVNPGNVNYDAKGNQLVGDVNGWNFQENNANISDVNGHGTNVAGIIAAKVNNSTGYAGVDWNCKIMNLRMYDSDMNGTPESLASAIAYAVNNGARVINISNTTYKNYATVKEEIENAVSKSVVVIAAMGNINNYAPDFTDYYVYPAALASCTYYPTTCNGVIAVGATDPTDHRWVVSSTEGSNHRNYISVVAPGQYIYGLYYESDTNYTVAYSGTSQAAPFVSGLASLLLAQNPSRTPAQIKTIIQDTAEKVGSDPYNASGWNEYCGYGRINAYEALAKYLSTDDVVSKSDEIQVYPNPAPHQFYCRYSLGTKQVDIYSTLGQLVTSKKVEGTDTQSFYLPQAGVYFIQFTLKDNKKVNKKMVIIQ